MSRTDLANDVLTAAERALYGCPDWCIRTDHHADQIGPDDAAWHCGPSFGPVVQTGAIGAETPKAHISTEAWDLTPVQLRKHAGNALAAAAWLEANQ